ncbi:MAG TPA: 30S ribosomal protein S8 [Candidatus Norongarragalinales archaeon]|nr:30S ribosomal protein S8 [Candidatus Norongarragalinales archaeon]
MDTLANGLNSMKVAEMKGRKLASVRPASKVMRQVLLLLQKRGFIGEFKFVDDGKSGEFKISLVGKINDIGAIKPRFPVSKKTWEKFETRFLPAKGVGLLVVSTSKGIMSHSDAQAQKVGGRLLCFVY